LEQVTQTWLAMPRSPGAEQEAAEEFYRQEVFPLVRQGFGPRERRKIDGECDGLILPVGTSPEPLILSIATLKPKQVLFLHTPETLRYVDEVVAATRLKPTEFERVEIDGSNALEIYEAIKAAFQKWGPEARLYVDFTGGKKAMVAGAAMAGAVIGANLIYIDNTRYLGDLRRPYPGTEYLSLVPNPYAVFGDLEEERAVNLFGQHDYATAAAIFQDLATRVPDAQLMVRYHLFGLLSRGYEAWDNFRLDEAEAALRTLIRELERYAPLEKDLPLLDRLEPLRQQAAAVAILNRDLNPQAKFLPLGFLQDLSRITPLLFTFYHSARRREEQNKLDMAVLLWYRLLEIIGQRRLATYGLDSARPDYEGAGFKRRKT
jgi:CRISPR-associated protein (TIGR02710 family)